LPAVPRSTALIFGPPVGADVGADVGELVGGDVGGLVGALALTRATADSNKRFNFMVDLEV
jgi:hypothetical protein